MKLTPIEWSSFSIYLLFMIVAFVYTAYWAIIKWNSRTNNLYFYIAIISISVILIISLVVLFAITYSMYIGLWWQIELSKLIVAIAMCVMLGINIFLTDKYIN